MCLVAAAPDPKSPLFPGLLHSTRSSHTLLIFLRDLDEVDNRDIETLERDDPL
jgi:hypothetical protein